MQTLNKAAQIAHLQGRTGFERNKAIYDMLMACRDAQHPTTGVTPYLTLSNTPVWRKLEHTITSLKRTKQREMMDGRDMLYKDMMKLV